MLKKIYKTIKEDNSTITIYGSNRDIKTYYKKPDWSEDEEIAFKYRGREYFLSEFMNVHNNVYNPNPLEWMKEFSGYMSDSYFSGVLIKISEDGDTDYIKAYTYVS
jgi:hypothetical protein